MTVALSQPAQLVIREGVEHGIVSTSALGGAELSTFSSVVLGNREQESRRIPKKDKCEGAEVVRGEKH